MGGTTAAPPKIDQNKAYDASQFLKRLVDDVIIDRDAVSMEQAITPLFSKDSDGKVVLTEASRVAAADRLVASLDELDRHDTRTAEEQAAWNEASAVIHQIFQDPANDSPEKIAAALKQYQQHELTRPLANPDDKRRDFWTLFGQSGSDFAVTFNEAQLQQLRNLLNKIAPGLGDVIVDVIDHMSGNATRIEGSDFERRMGNELQQGFDAMMRGQVSLGGFWDKAHKTSFASGQEEPVGFNVWNGPANGTEWAAFFTHDGMRGHGYQFYDDDARTYTQSFEDMILSKWEADGVLSFENDAARQQFIQYSGQLVMGGELDETFAATLEQNGTIQFANDAARQAFIDFTKTIDTRMPSGDENLTVEEYIAKQVMDYVESRPDMNFLAQDPSFDPHVYFAPTRDAVMAAVDQYVPVHDGHEYAQKVIEYARLPNSGVNVHLGAAAPAPSGVTVSDGVRTDSEPDPAAPATPSAEVIQADKLDAGETGLLDYGQEIPAKLSDTDLSVTTPDGTVLFKFSDDGFEVFSASKVDPGTGEPMIVLDAFDTKMSAAELRARLGDGFKVQLVAHEDPGTDVSDSQLFGYYIESADGKTRFFVGSEGIPEESVTADMKSVRMQSLEDGAHNDGPGAGGVKLAQDSGAMRDVESRTVDGQQQDPQMFTP